MNKSIQIYTDGSAPGNGVNPGGWAAIILYNNEQYILKGHTNTPTTNNRMELTAIIEALKRLERLSNTSIEIYTDSQYVRNGIVSWIQTWIKNDWRKSDGKPVLNKDLWEQLLTYSKKFNISWHWVKGHSTNQFNILADRIAQEQARLAKK